MVQPDIEPWLIGAADCSEEAFRMDPRRILCRITDYEDLLLQLIGMKILLALFQVIDGITWLGQKRGNTTSGLKHDHIMMLQLEIIWSNCSKEPMPN